mmetsp:Transcript_13962/g.30184  ORF Transcript_13962/g.30184 Transcript_13962/m.30184 type:complete len:169 (+) Transcript_13962:30-536(+)|eukprot:CAMPEP_0202890762 /NCGR_PEP_ID=MMETSP1392-20130828/1067_1 /ASSEMBLY_ACC=CAM_ASM_000868 /TAXON_ID=225041 /ORGANISM="Chlamydomonas chlamydogama, Strain SAG 11-48b" /LENGTH=168 /DNA_ID=CAMNT_0049574393 /DNA_START=30 /DNA_END=536 /DNA_ORIENTATION=+
MSDGEDNAGGNVREQDRFLPIANIARIMKKALPNNAKIAKDAKETVQECVSEFISFITSEASDKCQREKRKTINGDDLLWSMSTLGFEDYVEPLKLYLQKFREAEAKEAGAGKKETGPAPPVHAQVPRPQAGVQLHSFPGIQAGFVPGMGLPPGMMPGYPQSQPPPPK